MYDGNARSFASRASQGASAHQQLDSRPPVTTGRSTSFVGSQQGNLRCAHKVCLRSRVIASVFKLCRWQPQSPSSFRGLQGSKPLQFESALQETSMTLCMTGRTAGARKELGLATEDAGPQIYVLSHLACISMEHFVPSASRAIPSGLSINWHPPASGSWNLSSPYPTRCGMAEATLAASGRKAGASGNVQSVPRWITHYNMATSGTAHSPEAACYLLLWIPIPYHCSSLFKADSSKAAGRPLLPHLHLLFVCPAACCRNSLPISLTPRPVPRSSR